MKGVYEDVSKIQGQLESFVFESKVSSEEINLNVMEFHNCMVVRLRTFDKKFVNYKLLIREIKYESSNTDPNSSYDFKYEHVLVTKGYQNSCMRVISCVTNSERRYFICRSAYEVGVSREERLPEIDDCLVHLLYRVETEEV